MLGGFAFLETSGSGPIREAEVDDEALVRDFLATGEHDLFGLLVERYRDRVLRLASSVLGSELSAEAEDVVQEVFVRVYRKLSQFRAESAFSTWLYRITYRVAIDQRRRMARHRHADQRDSAPQSASGPSTLDEPLARSLAAERRRRVRRCVDRLPDPYRTAIYLHYWHGCTLVEIGDLMGARANTIKTYLFRGRRRLANLLQRGAR